MGKPRRTRRSEARPAPARRAAAPAEPLGAAPFALAAVVAAACVLALICFRLYDTDVWEHLAVGRAIWALRGVPTTEVWTWGNAGAPNVNPSWGFSVLLWPFWQAGGVTGLWVFRLLTTLGALALAWTTARRLGARGLAPLLTFVVVALMYRERAQVRPEMLAGVLLALTQLLLVRGGTGARAIVPLVAIAWLWANVHVSFWLFLLLLGIHAADAMLRRDAGARNTLLVAGVAGAAIAFVNPFGWHALVRPFEFFYRWRGDPMFSSIGELGPIQWHRAPYNGIALLLPGWPLLALWRTRRGGGEAREWLTLAAFTGLALTGHRFVATYALAATPYVARDLTEWAATLPAPRAWVRATLLALACVGLCAWNWKNGADPIGFGFDFDRTPVHACDWMEAHGVRGRGFNRFAYGGYMLWRFWPDTTRLPMIDIHPEDSTPRLRELDHAALTDPAGWGRLTTELRPDYALLSRRDSFRPNMLDVVDEDAAWALVFVDDVAAIYVRRDGPLGALASRFGYATLGGSLRGQSPRLERAGADPAFRAMMRTELLRQAAESPVNFYGRSMLRALDRMGS